MEYRIKYEFSAEVWQYAGPKGWYFVSVPRSVAEEIRTHLKWQEEGWGRLKASASTGGCEWDTALWYDTKHQTYLLPIKADVRRKANVAAGSEISVTIWV